MNKDSNHKLTSIRKQISTFKKSQRFMADAEIRLVAEELKLAKLFHIMKMEENDVKKLESFSFTALYHNLMGNKQVELNREQSEFFSAKLKYDSCLSGIKSIKSEIESHKTNINAANQLETEYQTLLKEFAIELKFKGDESFYDVSEKIAEFEVEAKELNEAKDVGVKALTSAQSAFEMMSSAGNWGVFDMVGGGFIAAAVKHSKINSAKQEMETLRNHMEMFQRELQDVNVTSHHYSIDINVFTTAADFILDGLIFDWLVQSKINHCKTQLKKLIDEIKMLQNHISHYLEKCNDELEILQQQSEQIINAKISA